MSPNNSYTATEIRMNYTDVERFMLEAIKEGRKALPTCLPNPPVGCVLVRAGKVIARGHTNEPGGLHAEAMALSQVKDNLDEVSAFITLEPCSFHGRTPSCAKALILSGIKSIYVAIIDPHPKNNGAGIKLLQDAGINVTLGILAESAHTELGEYLCNSV